MNSVKLSLFTFILTFLCSCGQPDDQRLILGRASAEIRVREALSENSGHNVIDNKRKIVQDSNMAISIAEPILFSIYGKDNIISQRPYEIYFIENYWVIAGTLPKKILGGTFLIITDARDGKIIKLTHSK